MGGLFCEKIFGPAKDYECHCGKYKKIRYQGITCEKCGVEVISKEWRRERFGHIELVSPCSHIWYLKGIPSRMIKEIQKVYAAQGIGISDKHLEVIIRQMLRKMVIIDGGDTDLLPGTRVDIDRYTLSNQEALVNGKRPALGHPLVLGITKAALETESFLSAASFQETTRVLTDAAIKAKRDNLHDLHRKRSGG